MWIGLLYAETRRSKSRQRCESVSVFQGCLFNSTKILDKKDGRKRESRSLPFPFRFFLFFFSLLFLSFPINYARLKTKSWARALVQQIIGRVFFSACLTSRRAISLPPLEEFLASRREGTLFSRRSVLFKTM